MGAEIIIAPPMNNSAFTTIAPHGGTLIDRALTGDAAAAARERAGRLPKIPLSAVNLSDLELLAIGAYSPLTGFLCREDYRAVVNDLRLKSGLVWSVPVTLPVTDDIADGIREGDAVALCEGMRPLAIMTVAEKFGYDRELEARQVYRTADAAHPGVARLYRQGDTLLGGEVQLFDRPSVMDNEFPALRLTPAQTRQRFAERGWRRVVGFQTRNPIHRAHEYIQKVAMEIVDGLLLHPLVGETKADDIPADVRMESYQALLRDYYPADRVVLSVFPAAMRYAGPREAIFHALCRKNYGCTHFIVGRDHAGVGNYYGTYDAQRIFDDFAPAEIGITPLFFEHTFYCRKCGGVVSAKTCPHGKEDWLILSGTQVRQMLERGESLPEEFTRPAVGNALKVRKVENVASVPIPQNPQNVASAPSRPGFTLWFTGLSGAGKSTLAEAVAADLGALGVKLEILDGDVVRTHLSKGLGFSKEDRDTNIRRIGWVCQVLSRNGVAAIAAAISPYRDIRDEIRANIKDFVEVYVEAPLDVLVERDVKGLYKKAIAGEIKNFTGVSDPYEAPLNAEVVCNSATETVEASKAKILDALRARGYIP